MAEFRFPGERTPSLIEQIANTYSALSPENLYCDGEISVAAGNRKARGLNAKLARLLKQYGRPVDECEAYDLARKERA
jgi:hypothetical protein